MENKLGPCRKGHTRTRDGSGRGRCYVCQAKYREKSWAKIVMVRTRDSIPRGAIERFWSKVEKGPDCWDWQASLMQRGYGQFTVRGVPFRAHRFSWTISNGHPPDGMMVCHSCDNRRCVRPSHLFLGSALDNHDDMAGKGRRVSAMALRTHCPQGHKLPDKKNNYGRRPCHLCHAVQNKRYRTRVREAIDAARSVGGK